jgi:hypothetical protein
MAPRATLGQFVSHSLEHPPALLAQEFTEVAFEVAGAEQAALYIHVDGTVRCHGLAPAQLESPLRSEQADTRFPWDIPSLQPRHFVLVEDAGQLPLPGGGQLRDLGIVSAVHVPLGPTSVGALHLYWNRKLHAWDDQIGAQLRAVGGFVVGRLVGSGRGRIAYGRRRTDP